MLVELLNNVAFERMWENKPLQSELGKNKRMVVKVIDFRGNEVGR